MPSVRQDDIGELEERITRLEGSSEGFMATRRFDKALPQMEQLDGLYDRWGDSIKALRARGAMSPGRAKHQLGRVKWKRTHSDMRRATTLQKMGRLEEARGVYNDIIGRTGIHRRHVLAAMLDLVELHRDAGEKEEAWGAFGRAEKFHRRLGPNDRLPGELQRVRRKLTERIGSPPPRKKESRRRKR